VEGVEERLFRALHEAGMSEVPEAFSVAAVAQVVPAATLAGIDEFIRVFERVTTRRSWWEHVTASVPEVARTPRREVCFFSAWDFHVPVGAADGWQLIEFNDNGSGLLFAALINHHFHELDEPTRRSGAEAPPTFAAFGEQLLATIEAEARAFWDAPPSDLFLVLDDRESLERGKFRDELLMLRDLLRRAGRRAEVGSPSDLRWNGSDLLLDDAAVCFVVNRSTDFFWRADEFSALREAYRGGRVYVAPNPFSYATRSDKRLLELLSLPDHDRTLGIRPEERAVLSRHVPETRLVCEENLDPLVSRRQDLVFKPAHGYASRGLLPAHEVGRRRLRRLLKKGERYVAQRRVPKASLVSAGDPAGRLWADLRVWAYRGARTLLSGRGSRSPDSLDLRRPGGWLPTYAATPPAAPGEGRAM